MPKLYGDDPVFNWTPQNPKQEEFVVSKGRFICGSGGKGGGKTVALVRRTILLLIDSPVFGDMTGNVGVIGRNHEKDFTRTTFPELKKWLPRKWIKKIYVKDGLLELTNGSSLWFAHYDNIDSILSLNLGFAAVDQMEEIPEDVFEELAYNRVRLKTKMRYTPGGQLISPRFDENGYCISESQEERDAALDYHTVFGVVNPRRCWVYNKFVKNHEYLMSIDPRIQDKHNQNYVLINIPTTENTKYLPVGYVDIQAQDKNQRAYRRDVLGLWDAFEGQIYIDFSDDLIRDGEFVPPPGMPIYVGIDHGGSGQDSSFVTNTTAVVFLAYEERSGQQPLIHVFDELYLMGSTVAETVQAIDDKLKQIVIRQRYRLHDSIPADKRLNERAAVKAWRCDPSMKRGTDDGSETIMERYMRLASLRGMLMPLAPGTNNVAENIERNSWLMRQKMIDVNPRCINFINEHKSYEYGENEKPKNKQCDHLINAFEYITSALPVTHTTFRLPERNESVADRILRQSAMNNRRVDPVYGVMNA